LLDGKVGGAKLPDIEAMHAKAKTYATDVVAKADAGDKKAQEQLLLDRIERKSIQYEDAKKALAGLTELGKEERAKLEAKLPNIEMSGITATAWKDRVAAGKKLAEMFNAGRIPGGKDTAGFLNYVMMAAEADKDVKLAEKVVEQAKSAAEKDKTLERGISALEKRLEKLKSEGGK